MMKHKLLKFKLVFFIICQNIKSLLTGKVSFARFQYSLRKQFIISSRFKDSMYTGINNKIFIDPFAPYFPSRYFSKVLENNSVDTFPLKPNYAQISITNHCPCHCFHCHVMNTFEDDLPVEMIINTIDEMISMDFPLIFFVGGEPMSRFNDLVEFIGASRKHMDTRIFTSGIGADVDRLKKLKGAGLEGICISLDHFDEKIHNHQRGNRTAFQSACRTIEESAKLGYYVSTVCCTTSSMVQTGDVFKVVDFAERLGAHSIQINEIRPVGMARLRADKDMFLTTADKKSLIDYYKQQNNGKRNIAIVMPWYNEEPYNFGCLATAGQKAYIDAKGNVQPCELLKMGLGNIKDQNFKTIWDHFLMYCRHPVRDCIIHSLNAIMDNADELPIPSEKTYEVWPRLCEMETADMFSRFKVREPRR